MAALSIEAYEGPAGSGKTHMVVKRVLDLLDAGTPAADVTVVTASKDAAADIKHLLGLLLPGGREAAEGLRIVSARALTMEVLSQPESCALVGHGPRVMLDVERSVLMADLRLKGLDKDRASSLMHELWASWDSGRVLAPVPGSDAALYCDALSHYGAYDVRELAARALSCLDALPQVAERLSSAYMLVDDANLVGTAQLTLAERLAKASLVLTGDASIANPFFDASATGSSLRVYLQARSVEPQRFEAVPHTLRAGSTHVVKSPLPADEDVVVAKNVRYVLDNIAVDLSEEFVVATPEGSVSQADSDVRVVSLEDLVYPSDVAVVIPQGSWLKEVCQKLKVEHVPTVTCTEAQPVAGDPRHVASCASLQSFALLGLSANPRDLLSWRMWAALGRADVSCRSWAALESYAASKGVPEVDVLAGLSQDGPEPFEGAAFLAKRYAQASGIVLKAARKCGRQLVDAVSPLENLTFNRLCEPLVAQNAVELMARVNRNVVDRGFGGRLWDVRVGIPAAFGGLSTKVAIVAGANEGVLPHTDSRAHPARYANEYTVLRSVMSKATRWLTLSYIQGCDAERAQRTGAVVKRIKHARTGDVAMLAPSPLMRELGAERPSTMSGAQFVSCILCSNL